MLVQFNGAAGGLYQYTEDANFFRLLKAGGLVNLYFYIGGRVVATAEGVRAGYAERFGEVFTSVEIQTPDAQTVQFVTRLGGQVDYDQPPESVVTVINTGGAVTQTAVNASGVSAQLLAAKPQRRYLLIQNQDAANAVFIRLDGAAVSAANGLKIPAGGSFVAESYTPTGEVTVIAAAGTPLLNVIEG